MECERPCRPEDHPRRRLPDQRAELLFPEEAGEPGGQGGQLCARAGQQQRHRQSRPRQAQLRIRRQGSVVEEAADGGLGHGPHLRGVTFRPTQYGALPPLHDAAGQDQRQCINDPRVEHGAFWAAECETGPDSAAHGE